MRRGCRASGGGGEWCLITRRSRSSGCVTRRRWRSCSPGCWGCAGGRGLCRWGGAIDGDEGRGERRRGRPIAAMGRSRGRSLRRRRRPIAVRTSSMGPRAGMSCLSGCARARVARRPCGRQRKGSTGGGRVTEGPARREQPEGAAVKVELDPERFVTRAEGRRAWLREGRRGLDEQRASRARPVARSRAGRLLEAARRRCPHPPGHLLDLRARVRLRHALVNQRGEWTQRIQAVLYHHGCPARRQLMTETGRRGWRASRWRTPPTSRSRSRSR